MPTFEDLGIAGGVLAANYYATTLTIWFGHWFSHREHSPSRGFHVGGHHVFYPDSLHALSRRFIYGSGRQDSIYALLPWLILQQIAAYMILPAWLFYVCLAGSAAVVATLNYVHTQYHLFDSALESHAWFCRARSIHFAHHDADVNFAVVDPFWDRVFRTFCPTAERPQGARDTK